MAEYNQTISTLHHLLDFDARRFAGAEMELKYALPEWISRADSLKLKTVLQKYLDFIQHHTEMLNGFFEAEQTGSFDLRNRVMTAFIEETREKIAACADAPTRDACLLASIQAICHFKISMYGTAAAFAKALQMENQASLFHQAEMNEKEIDGRLSQLAEVEVNKYARSPVVLPG
jgi:ferritin-like metal-binding protein YciE